MKKLPIFRSSVVLHTTLKYAKVYQITMNKISITYTLVWEVKDYEEYKFSSCGKCFNTKRNTELKKVMQGGSIGYNIRGKFKSLKILRNNLHKIKKTESPF